MKIVIITQGVSRIVKPLIGEFNIVGVVESAPRGYKPYGLKALIRFVRFLIALLGKEKSLKAFCIKRGIPYKLLFVGNDEEVSEWLKKLSPDLIVVFSMSHLLRNNILSIPKKGVINLHPSFLPFYRGPNPDFWQYYDAETNPGVTIHYVDEGEDTGDIIYQERAEIPLGTKSPERLDKLISNVGVQLLIQSIKDINDGSIRAIKQPTKSPNQRASNLKISEHKNVIDWQNWPIERIWNLLRGTELWMNAVEQPSGFYRGQRWSIGNYEKIKSPVNAKDGAVFLEANRVFVACKDGRIELFLRFNFIRMVRGLLKI